VNDDRVLFWVLYATRFADGFGFITLVTLLPSYINVLDPSGATIFGATVGAGFVIGMYTTGLTLAQTAVVVPLSWAGDRFDKRAVLLLALSLGVVVYASFPVVDSSASLVLVRAAQGVAVTGVSLMSLSLVGQIADVGTRANHIGKANASRFAASILGSLAAGVLYEVFGFGPVFLVIVCLMVIAWVGVVRYLDPDDTRIPGFPFRDLALNGRILTITSFRVQYAFAVTLVRTWVPIYAGVTAAQGGLAYGALAVSLTVVAEKLTNILCQPFTGRLSDRYGRARFVFAGGGLYGLVALLVPFSPHIGAVFALPETYPFLGVLSPAFVPLLALSGLLGVADSFREPASMALFADEGTTEGGVASSFGIRELVWRPGSVVAPLLGGWLMTSVSMDWVFYVGGAFALTGILTFSRSSCLHTARKRSPSGRYWRVDPGETDGLLDRYRSLSTTTSVDRPRPERWYPFSIPLKPPRSPCSRRVRGHGFRRFIEEKRGTHVASQYSSIDVKRRSSRVRGLRRSGRFPRRDTRPTLSSWVLGSVARPVIVYRSHRSRCRSCSPSPTRSIAVLG
jgi:MFS family permease